MAQEYDALKKRVGKRLAHERARRGFTQEDAADFLKAKIRTYQRWEAGKALPQAKNLQRISDAYEIDIDELIGVPPNHSGDLPLLLKQLADAVQRNAEALERIERRLDPDPLDELDDSDNEETDPAKANPKVASEGTSR